MFIANEQDSTPRSVPRSARSAMFIANDKFNPALRQERNVYSQRQDSTPRSARSAIFRS